MDVELDNVMYTEVRDFNGEATELLVCAEESGEYV